jgi:FAD/FMN-containing dehydrogenase
MRAATSWGRWPRTEQGIVPIRTRFEPLPKLRSLLPYGNGRSYGDVCLNAGGTLLATRTMDRLINFDPTTGILECESGVLLSEIIELLLPRGWFPAVAPGTAFVTVGGAIANDIHGKNHHLVGSFGHHVLSFELLRSDGEVLQCSAADNAKWFHATIGGMGLTGLIRTVRLRLRAVTGPWIAGDCRRFQSISEFFDLSAASDHEYEYTVAWLDSTAHPPGRGVFMRGNHVSASEAFARGGTAREPRAGKMLRVPLTPPISPLFGASVKLLNACYYWRRSAQQNRAVWHYQDFHFPLDRILDWNRLYGPLGFFQYQCALPNETARPALSDILALIARARQSSCLSVLKQFGTTPSLGLMSFARPGVTLALDFPNRGALTLRLLESLDSITRQAGGAVYPAKDARMSAISFQQYFPAWQNFQRYIDPCFSSSFWRRVTAPEAEIQTLRPST